MKNISLKTFGRIVVVCSLSAMFVAGFAVARLNVPHSATSQTPSLRFAGDGQETHGTGGKRTLLAGDGQETHGTGGKRSSLA